MLSFDMTCTEYDVHIVLFCMWKLVRVYRASLRGVGTRSYCLKSEDSASSGIVGDLKLPDT